jgi:hypothetical protein
MKPALSNLADPELCQLGVEASRLLCSGQVRSLHEQFGYALAFDREPISALESDIAAVLSEVGATSFGEPGGIKCKVSHYDPGETGTLSLVECLVPTNGSKQLLVELVLTNTGSEHFFTLEQVSSAT